MDVNLLFSVATCMVNTVPTDFWCLYPGYGDLSATNVREMIYAIAVMVAGKLIFGFILGSIASTLANLDTQRVLFEEKLSALKVCVLQYMVVVLCSLLTPCL